jgi:hypothetical protein
MLLTLRVVGHLPGRAEPSELGGAGGQASDKPRGRKPREELAGFNEAASYGDWSAVFVRVARNNRWTRAAWPTDVGVGGEHKSLCRW